jgi:hypothetical protein
VTVAPTATIKVSPQVYYVAAAALHTAAADLFTEVLGKWTALSECAHMAGTYDDAKKWADSYDTRSWEALTAATTLAAAMDSYAAVLRQQGYNHALADYNATIGDKGAPPEKPASPVPAVSVCQVPPPSAGGPGNGLDDAVQLAQKVGIPIPDGDTGKLGAVGDAWAALAAVHPVAGLADELGRIMGLIEVQESPEIEFVVTDLKQLQSSAQTVASGFTGLANACHDHRAALDELRAKLKAQLEDLAKELLEQLAITAVIGVATSLITFGIGAAVASARVATIVARFAGPIRDIVEAWKAARNLKKGVQLEKDLAAESRSLQQIEKLGQDLEKMEADAGGATAPAAVTLSQADRAALWEYTGPDAERLNWVLRNDAAGPRDKLITDDINTALSKLPDYQGEVTRRLTLSEEDLARYEPGRSVTEKAFTSSSKSSEAAFDRPVEMQIVSKHGKDVSEFARKPEEQEVLFRTNTTFDIVGKYFARPPAAPSSRWPNDRENSHGRRDQRTHLFVPRRRRAAPAVAGGNRRDQTPPRGPRCPPQGHPTRAAHPLVRPVR